ncbi:nectin-1-like [Saccostrea echinata]|uniref:nectin-1-like n=1 Tax=Saccostrea echinata TaxID=191078 RepID=UPI002A82BA53|nr:nectin-1-like [Saccostrea echinata]
MSICFTDIQKEDAGQFSLKIGVYDYRENVTLSVTGVATLSVMPASDVLVNQTVTFECVYANGQLGAAFSYGQRNCMFVYNSCSGCRLFTSFECPNNQTYRISTTVDSSWHKVTMYCAPPFGGPKSNTITLNVTIPVSTLILTPSQLRVNRGETITLTCRTDYCNPPAKITWYKATSDVTSQATSTEDINQEDLVRTTSVLRFTSVVGDNGQQVHCIASNAQGHSVESNRYTLDVRYISDVKILPGSLLNVLVGQKYVWMYCYTENPKDHAEYSWTKINSNNSSIVSTGQLYVIQTATIEDGGRYTCTATNSVGNSSGSVVVSVQYTPIAPVLVHVDCRTREAYILWKSFSTYYADNIQEETLQLSESKNVFLNASYEKINRTDDIEINTYKVTELKPGSVYVFRFLTSNRYGIALSNNQSCITDTERMEDTNKGCRTEQIIRGILGGAVLTIMLVIVAYALCEYRKERRSEG